MSEFSSSKMSSSSMSSSSVKSSSTSVKSSSLSASSSLEVDDLMSSSRLGRGMDMDIDNLMSSTTRGVGKKMSAMSDFDDAFGSSDASVKSSSKSFSSSSSSAAVLQQKSEYVDGKLVNAETLAEKASAKSESAKEKVVEDGKVLKDTGYNVVQTCEGKLKATKEMGDDELNSFFRDTAITGRPTEALEPSKESNNYQMKLTDLPEFSPSELTVKIVDRVITVVGTHEESKEDGTFQTLRYVRRFTVPKDLEADHVAWELEPSGILAITAGPSNVGQKSQVHLDCTIYKPKSFFKKSS